jgi:hypothetical protein
MRPPKSQTMTRARASVRSRPSRSRSRARAADRAATRARPTSFTSRTGVASEAPSLPSSAMPAGATVGDDPAGAQEGPVAQALAARGIRLDLAGPAGIRTARRSRSARRTRLPLSDQACSVEGWIGGGGMRHQYARRIADALMQIRVAAHSPVPGGRAPACAVTGRGPVGAQRVRMLAPWSGRNPHGRSGIAWCLDEPGWPHAVPTTPPAYGCASARSVSVIAARHSRSDPKRRLRPDRPDATRVRTCGDRRRNARAT